MMDEPTLADWLDRHHVNVIRTMATPFDGMSLGKYVHRRKFEATMPRGHAVADIATTMDFAGTPHLTFWHEDRLDGLGDIFLRPDLTTLISDGTDPDLGHVICDFVHEDGTPHIFCPRSILKRQVAELASFGFEMKATFELEFYLFDESFEDLRRKQYRQLRPVSPHDMSNIYLLRNAYLATPFMREVTRRLDWRGIEWEGWNDENGIGQLELNLVPTDPVTAADHVVAIRQIMYEVAVDQGKAVTFMPKPTSSYGSGMHVHHSLLKDGTPQFYDSDADNSQSATMRHWLGGLIATLPGAMSFFTPTMNSWRRVAEFGAVPTTTHWGEQNKTTALRTITSSSGAARIEHRVGAADLNPYLGLAAIVAGGIAGLREQAPPPPAFDRMAWGLPEGEHTLPGSMTLAAERLLADDALRQELGEGVVQYWAKTRELEWLSFHTEGGDPEARETTLWEFARYFTLV